MNVISVCILVVLGLGFVPLKAAGWKIQAIRFHFNIYTGPGYLGGFLGMLNVLLLIFFFWERKLPSNPEDRPLKKVLKCKLVGLLSTIESFFTPPASFRDSLRRYVSHPKWDPWAAGASVVLFFVILFVFAVFET